MGMGQIGDGVKRIRITQEETEKLEELNFTISLFIATILNKDFDRVNTLAGFLKVWVYSRGFFRGIDIFRCTERNVKFPKINFHRIPYLGALLYVTVYGRLRLAKTYFQGANATRSRKRYSTRQIITKKYLQFIR